ncbi:hypothetical protein Aduo_011473 [Ancylostoma duodenale]
MSIWKQECRGDERKEMELRKKNSPYLTPYVIALAMDAHRRRCHEYDTRLDAAKRVRFDHPAVFPWPVDFNVGDYITMAISMLDHVEAPCLTNNSDHDVSIASPTSFARVNAEIAYEENVTVYVFTDFSTSAEKFMKTQITRSIIVIKAIFNSLSDSEEKEQEQFEMLGQMSLFSCSHNVVTNGKKTPHLQKKAKEIGIELSSLTMKKQH